jgi:hypothetical protein
MSTIIFLYRKKILTLLYGMIMKTQKLPKEYLAELGHRLKVIRTVLKLDQRQLSELLDTGQSQISKIEIGRSAPTLYYLIKIKQLADKNKYLNENISWEWILEGKGHGVIR